MSAKTCRLLHLLLLGAFFAGSLMVYPALPERFPVHFDLAGRPDAWADRRLAAWLALPLIAASVFVLLEGASRFAARYPHYWSVPEKRRFLELSPSARAPIVQRMQALVSLVGLLSTALMAVVQAGIYLAATRPVPRMPAIVLAAVAVEMVVIITLALRMNSRLGTMIREAHGRPAAS